MKMRVCLAVTAALVTGLLFVDAQKLNKEQGRSETISVGEPRPQPSGGQSPGHISADEPGGPLASLPRGPKPQPSGELRPVYRTVNGHGWPWTPLSSEPRPPSTAVPRPGSRSVDVRGHGLPWMPHVPKPRSPSPVVARSGIRSVDAGHTTYIQDLGLPWIPHAREPRPRSPFALRPESTSGDVSIIGCILESGACNFDDECCDNYLNMCHSGKCTPPFIF